MNLKDTVAIVTGGGTGIGRATCLAIAAERPSAVIVNYAHSEQEALQTVADLQALGCRAQAIHADVGDDRAARAMVDAALEQHGRLDVLVNCAGTTTYAPFPDLEALTDDVWERILHVNLLGAFYCSRASAPALRRSRGAIVNICSVSAYRGAGSSLAYGVSKAALLQLTRGLAVALAPEVRVNAVSPGKVTTRWHVDHLGAEQAEANARAEAERVPLHRVAAAADIAQAVMGLLGADLVTGESLIVDGGKHLLY